MNLDEIWTRFLRILFQSLMNFYSNSWKCFLICLFPKLLCRFSIIFYLNFDWKFSIRRWKTVLFKRFSWHCEVHWHFNLLICCSSWLIHFFDFLKGTLKLNGFQTLAIEFSKEFWIWTGNLQKLCRIL